MEKKEIFISGYAKLPQGITAAELYTVIAVGLIVEEFSGEILEVDCTLSTEVAKGFVKKLLTGRNLRDLETIEKVFSESYHGSARKALISAIRIANERYANLKKGQTEYQD